MPVLSAAHDDRSRNDRLRGTRPDRSTRGRARLDISRCLGSANTRQGQTPARRRRDKREEHGGCVVLRYRKHRNGRATRSGVLQRYPFMPASPRTGAVQETPAKDQLLETEPGDRRSGTIDRHPRRPFQRPDRPRSFERGTVRPMGEGIPRGPRRYPSKAMNPPGAGVRTEPAAAERRPTILQDPSSLHDVVQNKRRRRTRRTGQRRKASSFSWMTTGVTSMPSDRCSTPSGGQWWS